MIDIIVLCLGPRQTNFLFVFCFLFFMLQSNSLTLSTVKHVDRYLFISANHGYRNISQTTEMQYRVLGLCISTSCRFQLPRNNATNHANFAPLQNLCWEMNYHVQSIKRRVTVRLCSEIILAYLVY